MEACHGSPDEADDETHAVVNDTGVEISSEARPALGDTGFGSREPEGADVSDGEVSHVATSIGTHCVPSLPLYPAIHSLIAIALAGFCILLDSANC